MIYGTRSSRPPADGSIARPPRNGIRLYRIQIFRPKTSRAGLARVCAWLARSSELANAAARDAQPAHQRHERQRVVALPGTDHPGQRPAPGIGEQVNLAGQPAPRPAQGLPVLVTRLTP